MSSPRILLVSYHYPPTGGSGVQRAASLAREWSMAGVIVHVLTADHRHFPLMDDFISNGANDGVVVHRVRGLDPGGLSRRLVPTEKLLGEKMTTALQRRVYWRVQRLAERMAMLGPESWWLSAARRAAISIIRRHKIDVMVTTSPPHCVQSIGVEIKRKSGVKWIADLRDPIVDNFCYAPRTRREDRQWRAMEANIVRASDRVVVTCDDYADHLRDKYRLASPDISCLTNGYDPNDPRDLRVSKTNSTFSLVHVGSFYHSQSPETVLKACRALRTERDDLRRNLKLRLVGSIASHLSTLFKPGDEAFVERAGYVDHPAAIREMRQADALFLMTPEHAHGRLCYPSKIFEYLGIGRRVIALVHRGSSLERLLSRASGVQLAFHDDPDSLKEAIASAFDCRSGERPNEARDEAFLRTIERSKIARRYLELIESLEDSCKLKRREMARAR